MAAGQCFMTTVNMCEVLGKLCDAGVPINEASKAMADLGLTFVDFDAELAKTAAEMRATTKAIGASLGDRSCLALARKMAHNGQVAVALTAEQAWGKLRWPFKVVAIR